MLVGCSVLLRIEHESRVMVVLALSWNEIRVVFLSSEFILCGVDLLLSSARCARRTAELRKRNYILFTYFLHFSKFLPHLTHISPLYPFLM